MSRKGSRPDPGKALAGLKDFQLRTVEHVFRRLYTDADYTRRFLIADEVGLGKTLVAKGVIAKAIDHLWDRVGRIDIVYICSNADIARQNIARLNVVCDQEFSMPDRITLLPERVKGLESNRLNFVAFTPGTSFHLKSSTGRIAERALLFRLLKKAWGLRGKAPRYVMRVNASIKSFDRQCLWYLSDEADIDEKLSESFTRELGRRIAEDQQKGKPDLRMRFDNLCSAFGRVDSNASNDDFSERASVIGELRGLLASVCLEALEPDLIILDEFQRFKNLLKAENDAGVLARNLFRFTDEEEGSEARVILLSATPYKMYTMDHEVADDDHYDDFLATMGFLLEDPEAETEFAGLLGAYSREFFRPGGVDMGRLLELKSDMERRLRKVMVRTEKLTATENRDGMLKQVALKSQSLQPQDLKAFVRQQELAELLGHSSVVEYWKSAPYLLNFMDDYALKRRFRREVGYGANGELAALLGDRKHWLIKWGDISRYRQIDPMNAKLRVLLGDTVDTGMWRLLWMPPSLPYYRLRGPFANIAASGITKRLIFSCWKVVPKVVSTLISYEAERQASLSLDTTATNTVKARKARRPLLRFAMSDGRLTGMPVLGMIYPAFRLSELCDPLALRRMHGGDDTPSHDEILDAAEEHVANALAALRIEQAESGAADEKWYWAAPILLDMAANTEVAMAWFDQDELSSEWRWYSKRSSDGEHDGRWGDHIDEMIRVRDEFRADGLQLGRKPDDLARVLAQIGVSGLGCCALRSLTRHADAKTNMVDAAVRNEAGALAHSFLTLFNAPEAMAIIRGENRQEPYWLRVVEYCGAGCLQAVMDEYVHIMRESMGLHDTSVLDAASDLAEAMSDALSIRTGRVGVDDIRVSAGNGGGITLKAKHIRIRFALRFGADGADDGGEVTREDQVRASFNSPFWPFVLATTSIGQEGLDFHQYCHAVVHWNLPSNPVDLEQREGRVHRYKGHAVRKNLAREFATAAWDTSHSDPWASMFAAAVDDRDPKLSDIYPFWVLPSEGGSHIERHVLNLPLSRDEQRLKDLLGTLVSYRMVMGLSRQEDVLDYLRKHFPEQDLADMADKLRINLEPGA
jgi:hypothetical protein